MIPNPTRRTFLAGAMLAFAGCLSNRPPGYANPVVLNAVSTNEYPDAGEDIPIEVEFETWSHAEGGVDSTIDIAVHDDNGEQLHTETLPVKETPGETGMVSLTETVKFHAFNTSSWGSGVKKAITRVTDEVTGETSDRHLLILILEP